MQNSVILLESNPKGKFLECTISGTPKPGVVMELYTTAAVGGRNTWRVYTPGTDGKRRVCAVLLEPFHGASYDTAYVAGERGRLYFPLPGEELNMLALDVGTGTAEDLTITQTYTVDSGTGKLIVGTGTETWRPFQQVESTSHVLVTTGTLTHVMFTDAGAD